MVMEKKMADGIVSLTRPRFGKRSVAGQHIVRGGGPLGPHRVDEAEYDDRAAADLMSPLTKAIYVYLVKNYGIPINNKTTRSQAKNSKLFSNLTRPRFGKRSLHGPAALLGIVQVQGVQEKTGISDMAGVMKIFFCQISFILLLDYGKIIKN